MGSPPSTLDPALEKPKRRKKELKPHERGIIEGLKLAGMTTSDIARTVQSPKSTVQYTLDQAQKRNNGHSLPRCGAPRVYSIRDERAILRYVRAHPKAKHADIIKATGVAFSSSTVKRILRTHHYSRRDGTFDHTGTELCDEDDGEAERQGGAQKPINKGDTEGVVIQGLLVREDITPNVRRVTNTPWSITRGIGAGNIGHERSLDDGIEGIIPQRHEGTIEPSLPHGVEGFIERR